MLFKFSAHSFSDGNLNNELTNSKNFPPLQIILTMSDNLPMRIGFTKKGDMTDYEWYLLLAENGHRSYQYRLAIEINSKSLKSDRLVQTYKWLCLSALLGDIAAREIAQFVYLGMSQDEIFLADKLVEAWIEDKFDSFELIDTTGWSKELRHFMNHSI